MRYCDTTIFSMTVVCHRVFLKFWILVKWLPSLSEFASAQVSSKSDNFALIYGALTISNGFFYKSAVYATWTFLRVILLHLVKNLVKSDDRLLRYIQKPFSRWRPFTSFNFNFFGHVTVISCNIGCNTPKFIKIGRFFTEINGFNDFQNGGRPPSWNF